MRRVLLLVVLVAACGRTTRTRCERVCTFETQCADKLELTDLDFGSCVESCQELEREPRTHDLVEAHVRCVLAAKTCPEAVDCQ